MTPSHSDTPGADEPIEAKPVERRAMFNGMISVRRRGADRRSGMDRRSGKDRRGDPFEGQVARRKDDDEKP